jgi:hypothetical protein
VCLKAGRGLWDRFPEAAKDASTLHNPAFQTDFQAAITRNFKEDAWRRRFSTSSYGGTIFDLLLGQSDGHLLFNVIEAAQRVRRNQHLLAAKPTL